MSLRSSWRIRAVAAAAVALVLRVIAGVMEHQAEWVNLLFMIAALALLTIALVFLGLSFRPDERDDQRAAGDDTR